MKNIEINLILYIITIEHLIFPINKLYNLRSKTFSRDSKKIQICQKYFKLLSFFFLTFFCKKFKSVNI